MGPERGTQTDTQILRLIELALKKIQGSSSSSTGSLTDILEELENGNLVLGSGINQHDLGGHGTEPFDSGLKLRATEDDSSTGYTYIGYSAPNTPDSSTEWIIQRIILTTSGDIETNRMAYAIDSWDNRVTATYY